jgi:DNA-binding CsgD family transcriptional regulator
MLGILRSVYEATLEPDAWPRILALIAPQFGTGKGMFIRVDRTHPRDSINDVIGVQPGYAEALLARDLKADPLWRVMVKLPPGRAFRATELLPQQALHAAPLYQQIALPAGIEYGIGAVLENDAQFFSVIGLLRTGVDFAENDTATMAALVPHLRTAQRLSRRIAAGDAGRREALLSFDRARQALIVLDRSGYAIYRNEYANRVLANVRGLELRFGRFIFEGVAMQTEFEHAVRVAVGNPATGEAPVIHRIRVPRRDAGPPYVLSIVPITGPSDRVLLPDGAGCMVLLSDEEGVSPLPVERLAWLYRLTPAEARICEALYRVGSVESAARALSLTRHTVRSHLKSVYSKFGVATQAQLMQRLATSAQKAFGLRSSEFN